MNTSFETKTQASKRRASHEESKSSIAYPSRTLVHAKLEMTEPSDHDEREADAVANEVVRGGKIARKISGGSRGPSGIVIPRQMESRLAKSKGGGQQIPDGLRSIMETGFGQDFSQVRLHTDAEAASMNSSIHAKAFTHGSDIYFNRDQFAPETTDGQRLVAHELTHVVQGTGRIGRSPTPDENPVDNSDDSSAYESFILERPSVISRLVKADDPVLAFHQYTSNMVQKHTRFVESIKKYGHNSPYIINQQRREYQKSLVYKNGVGYAGSDEWIDSVSRSDAAVMYREIAENMSGGLFASWFACAASERGDDLLGQLNASRLGAGLDAMFTNQYGIKGRTTTTRGWRRVIEAVVLPIERGDTSEGLVPPGPAEQIVPNFNTPAATPKIAYNTEIAPETKAPSVPVSNPVRAEAAPEVAAPSVPVSNPVKAEVAPQLIIPKSSKRSVSDLVHYELYRVDNSPKDQLYLNQTIKNIRFYLKKSLYMKEYNMYLYNAEENVKLGNTGEAIRSLHALENDIELHEE